MTRLFSVTMVKVNNNSLKYYACIIKTPFFLKLILRLLPDYFLFLRPILVELNSRINFRK